jgi:hypothetical protein
MLLPEAVAIYEWSRETDCKADTNKENMKHAKAKLQCIRERTIVACVAARSLLNCRISARQVRAARKSDRPCNIKLVVSGVNLCLLMLPVVAIPAIAQAPSEQNSQLPSQAKEVHGVAMPVPKEIFRSLDQFRDANWRAVKRPQIARWKSHGDQVQIASLLGVAIAEGFIAMEAEDSIEVKNIGNRVLALSRALGLEKRALRRSRSIMELTDKNDWMAARKEWDGVLSDLQKGMIELKSADLFQLVSLFGWLRGTEALSALVLQNYSSEHADLLRQPGLINYLEKQLLAMSSDIQNRPMIVKLLDGIRRIRTVVERENRAPTEKTVREIDGICEELVRLSSRRPA